MHHRSLLCIRPTDGVDCRQFADTEGGDQGAQALDAAVAISGVTGIEFVAIPDPGQVAGGDVVEGGEVVVTRDAVDGVDAELVEAGEDIRG
jgi:hypothetical protein